MTIIREINGKDVEIELTGAEIAEAHLEYQGCQNHDWIEMLLLDYGYDIDRCEADDVSALVVAYEKELENNSYYNDTIGEMQHVIFEDLIRSGIFKNRFHKVPAEEGNE